MARKRFSGLIVAAAVTAVLAVPAALGSSGAQKAKTIQFGLIVPEKAPYFDDTQSIGAAKAALRAINARGGFNGVKGSLIFCNEKNDPNAASACARLMVQKHVAAVVGGVMLSGAVVQPILAAAHIPQVGIYPTTGQEFNGPNVYLLGGQGAFDWQIGTAYAAHQGVKFSFVGNDNAASAAAKPVLDKLIGKITGTGFVNSVTMPTTVADYTPLVAAAEAGGATGVVLYTDPDGNGKQFQLAAQAAHAPFKVYVRVGADLDLAKALGTDATKMVDVETFPFIGKPLVKNAWLTRFLKELAVERQHGDTFADAATQRTSSLGTWLGYQAIEQLAKTIPSGKLTAATLTRALNKAKNVNLGGIIPAWTPSKPGPEGYSRVSNPFMWVIGYTPTGQPKLLVKKPITVAQATSGKY